jgi:hypothetical protein
MEFYQGAPQMLFGDNMATCRKKGYGKDAELTDEFRMLAAHYGFEVKFANPGEPAEKGAVEVAAKTAGGILTPIPDVGGLPEVNGILLKESLHYIEHQGPVGLRPRSVKEMAAEEKPLLAPLPIKRYEVGVHDSAAVDNRQLCKFDGCVYSVPRPYAGKRVAIITYAYRVEFYCRGDRIWECDRPLFEWENRVFAEHYLYDLRIKPRSRENAFPLLEGVLPPPLHAFRELCRSRTTKNYQLYMLMRKMDEVGRETLLAAVEAANAAGDPTLEKVEALLLPQDCGADADAEADVGIGALDRALLDDEFYVEHRDPSVYDELWRR